MIELEIVGGLMKGNKIVTNAAYVTIGRSQADDLVIPDPYVSWHHGEILRQGDAYMYRDLSSTHGTFLRREEVERRVERVQLKEGDKLLFAGTNSVLAVNLIAPHEATPDDFMLTLGDEHEEVLGEPSEVFANDAKALLAILHLDKALLAKEPEGRYGALKALTEQIAELHPALDYVAVLHQRKRKVEVVQSLSLLEKVVPRTSTRILRKTRKRRGGFVFAVHEGQLFSMSSQDFQELSPPSAVIEHDTSGICVPLHLAYGEILYLQMERASLHGEFDQRDLNLVSTLAMRTAEHLDHLTIASRYVAASQRAALGIFAHMLGHEIKNALIFAPYIQEKLADPNKHTDIHLGVERSYRLALSLQAPRRAYEVKLKPVKLRELVQDIAQGFSSMFSGLCRFEGVCPPRLHAITTHGELLRSVIGNLVLNAYTAHVNREVPVEQRYAQIRADSAQGERVRIHIKDNAGGLDESALEFIQNSFSLIAEAYQRKQDLLGVVEMMTAQRNGTNRVGLFFTAVAVDDMHGAITVMPNGKDGTCFTIEIPRKIKELKGHLQF